MPRWKRTLLVIVIAQFIGMVGFAFVFPFIPLYFQEVLGVASKHEAAAWAGWTRFGMGLTMAVFAPLWGLLADKFGRKIMMVRATFGAALILTLMGMVNSPLQFAMLRVGQGAITGTMVASITLVLSVTPREKKGYSLAIMQAAVYAGHALGPLLGGMMADTVGYREGFFVAGLLLAASGSLVVLGAEERFNRSPELVGTHHEKLSSVLKVKGFLVVIAVIFLIQSAITMLAPVFSLFVKDLSMDKARAATYTGRIICGASILAALSALAVSRVGGRWGYGRILAAGSVLSGLLAAPQALARRLVQLASLRLAYGFVFGGVNPMVNATVSTLVPGHSYGKAYGLTQSISCMGWAFGGLLTAFIAERGGEVLGLRLPFVVSGVFLVMAGVVAALGIHRPRPAVPTDELREGVPPAK